MSNRIMKMILSKKFESWKESIEDENVRMLVSKNTIITGGCIASMLLKEEINDFDLYFKNLETCEAVAHYYVNKFVSEHDNLKHIPTVNSEELDLEGKQRVRIKITSVGIVGENTDTNDKIQNGEDYVNEAINSEEILANADEVNADSVGNLHGKNTEQGKFKPVFLSDNAITLSDKVQLVLRFYGTAEEIHRNFDFIHCVNYWDSETKELVLKQEALESLLSKKLYYTNSQYPICALIRIRKFLRRGFYIDAGQILKICFQISKLDLEDIEVLSDQLVGVDSAYFCQLIDYIRQEKAKDENWNLELPYLISIIDRIF